MTYILINIIVLNFERILPERSEAKVLRMLLPEHKPAPCFLSAIIGQID